MPLQAKPTRNLNAKLAIIPVLGLALVWMLFGGSDEDSAEVAIPVASTVAQKAATTSTFQEAVERIARNWPDFNLDEVLDRDPFGGKPIIEELEKVGTTSIDETVVDESPEEWPVTVYLDSKDGPMALANGHVLQQGDVVDQKWRVLALSNKSVVLEPIE